MALDSVLQHGLPEFIPDLVAMASVLVVLLILVALGGFVYKSLTGGIEWPDEEETEEGSVRRGDSDDEWDYY